MGIKLIIATFLIFIVLGINLTTASVFLPNNPMNQDGSYPGGIPNLPQEVMDRINQSRMMNPVNINVYQVRSPYSFGTPIAHGVIDPENLQYPSQWKFDESTRTWYDPLSDTIWMYNVLLRKFYSPHKGWYLVNKFNLIGQSVEQLYFDSRTGEYLDPQTGESVDPVLFFSDQGSQQSSGKQDANINLENSPPELSPIINQDYSPNINSVITSEPTIKPSPIPSHTPPDNVVSENEPTDPVFSNENLDLLLSNDELPLPDQQEIPTDDQNGLQLSSESITPGDISCPLISCPTCGEGVECEDCDKDGICDQSYEGGLSEETQAPIYHFKSIRDNPDSCSIIECSEEQGCLFCQDCNKDGICEADIPLIIICESNDLCSVEGYCWDTNYDGMCDEPFTPEQK